jgi:hypothetical protein
MMGSKPVVTVESLISFRLSKPPSAKSLFAVSNLFETARNIFAHNSFAFLDGWRAGSNPARQFLLSSGAATQSISCCV